MYIRGVEEREEAGTPSIIGVIRAGLSFQLKEQLTPEFIEHKEHEIVQYVNQRFSQMKNIVLLGNNELDKVPIYSFMVRHQGKFLHFHFVGKLLNDLFGIQTRTGCSCAAVYGQQLLGIDLPLARKYKDALCHGHEMLRMGYVRLNFGYFMSQEDIDYILDAIEFVGKYGWMFLPDYTFDKEFAEFYVHADTDHKERNWIGEIDYTSGMMKYKNSNAFINDEAQLPSQEDVFKQAKETLITRILNYRHIYGKSAIDQRNIVDEEYQHLVFFIYPSEVLQDIENIIATHKDLKFEDLEAYITEDIEYASEIPFKPLDYTKKELSQKEEIKEQSAPEKEDKDEDDWLEEDCLPGMALMDEDEVEQKEEILPIIEPSKEIMKLVGEAIKDFDMIREGDGILVALSGGKDSLSLLNILRYLQKKAPVRFKLGAVTIDPKTVEYDPSPLKGYLKKLGVPYFYEEDNLIERAATSMQNNSI